MSQVFTLPQLGERSETGKILSVLVSTGDRIAREQAVVEVETDKATVEVPSDVEGVVREIHVAVGDEVEAGAELISVDGDGDAGGEEGHGEADQEADAEDGRAAGEEGAEEGSGRAQDAAHEETGERTSAKGEEAGGGPGEHTGRARPSGEAGSAPAGDGGRPRARPDLVPASPSVRRFARELGVDVTDVAGTGPRGRVEEDDVKSHVRALVERARLASDETDEPALPDLSTWGPVERRPADAVRRATARTVTRSWRTVPQVTQHDEADVTDLDEARARQERDGVRPSLTAVLVKVAGEALGHFPRLNAAWDAREEELVLCAARHVGVAVDSERGLLVPVLRDVASRGLHDVARELVALAERARGQRLEPDDLEGATFTVTNLGGLGTTTFTPLVPWPQVAILSAGRAAVRAVHRDGAFVPRRMLPLGITYDHRAVDGADAARFLRFVAEALSDPLRLLAAPGR